jgi:hypothetical protein
VNRLQTHKVADVSSLRHYLLSVTGFIDWVEHDNVLVITTADKDRALSDYLDRLCYFEEVGSGAGGHLLSGFQVVFPETIGALPESWNTLTSWEKVSPGGEGSPFTIPEVCLLERDLRLSGKEESADRLHVGVDLYARAQDLDQLQGRDVHLFRTQAAVSLGVVGRGETTKGGPRQGVVVDFPSTAEILRKRKAMIEEGERVFPGGGRRFGDDLRAAVTKRGFKKRPAHAVRHTLPSFDGFTKFREQREIQKRGRWSAPASTHRYSKDHVYLEHLAMLDDETVKEGEALFLAWGERARREDHEEVAMKVVSAVKALL